MKMPEEIKKGLRDCCPKYDGVHWVSCYDECPYKKSEGFWCRSVLHKDTLDYIAKLESRLAQVEREKDAALKDIANTCWSCANAKPHQLSKFLYSCPHLKGKAGVRTQCENWEWRGVCPENSKEDEK